MPDLKPPQMPGAQPTQLNAPGSPMQGPKNPAAQTKAMQKPAFALPKTTGSQNTAKKFSIMDRLKSKMSMPKMNIQSKVQNNAAMPGINSPMIGKKELLEMMDIIKGQMSKLGKPGAREAAAAQMKDFLEGRGHKASPPPAAPASVPPKKAKEVAHKIAAEKINPSHQAHTELKNNILGVSKPEIAAQPEVKHQAPKFTPQDYLRPKVVIRGSSDQAQKAVQAQKQKQFEQEKTAPAAPNLDSGTRDFNQEVTGEVTAKQSFANINDTKLYQQKSKEGINEHSGQNNSAERPESKPVTVALAKPAHEQAKPPTNSSKSIKSSAISSPNKSSDAHATSDNSSASRMKTQDIGVKKYFTPEQAHSALLTFLQTVNNPGAFGVPNTRQGTYHVNKSEKVEKAEATPSIPHQQHAVNQLRMHLKAKGRNKLASRKTANMQSIQNRNSLRMPTSSVPHVEEATPKLPAKMHKSEEATSKESLGATAERIKAGVKGKPAEEQVSVLTEPANFPHHNRKKLLAMLSKAQYCM